MASTARYTVTTQKGLVFVIAQKCVDAIGFPQSFFDLKSFLFRHQYLLPSQGASFTIHFGSFFSK